MEVAQICETINAATQQVLGESVILNENLTNVVDVGNQIFNANQYDNFAKALVDRIGVTRFVNKKLPGKMLWMFMENWTYGSVTQKIRTEMPDASNDPTYELEDGRVYVGKKFKQPKVYVKYWNSKTAYKIDLSFTRKQLEEAFTSASALDQFLEMLFMAVDNAIAKNFDMLARMVINNMIAATVYSEYGTGSLSEKSGVRAVNLLYRYNQYFGTKLTAAKAMLDTDFLKFAGFEIKNVISQLENPSRLFNINGYEGWVQSTDKVGYFLDRFYNATATYLQSDTFNKELVAMPEFYTTSFFQGSGTSFSMDDCQKIIVTANVLGSAGKVTAQEMTIPGIIGAVWDKWALGIRKYSPEVTSEYVPVARFYNNYTFQEAEYFNDFSDNFVVFFIA